MKKRVITAEHREKLRENIAKARAARQVNDPRVDEAVTLLSKILGGITSVYGDGRLDKRFCTICERTFVEAQANPCVCQDAWRFVEANKEAARGGQEND